MFVDRIPLNGRNANDLIRIVPGITTGVDGKYAANGIRETSNNFTLDGTDNSDTWEGAASRHPPPDALDEFAVQSNYSAEFGFGGGVAVIAITKSGTNQLRAESAGHVGFAPDEIVIRDNRLHAYSRTWVALCHGKAFRCSANQSGHTSCVEQVEPSSDER